jgi:hypothetical protein
MKHSSDLVFFFEKGQPQPLHQSMHAAFYYSSDLGMSLLFKENNYAGEGKF